jgi:hypothetical protein
VLRSLADTTSVPWDFGEQAFVGFGYLFFNGQLISLLMYRAIARSYPRSFGSVRFSDLRW